MLGVYSDIFPFISINLPSDNEKLTFTVAVPQKEIEVFILISILASTLYHRRQKPEEFPKRALN